MSRNAWSIPVATLAARAGLRVETVARKIVFELFKAVVLRSPVDTGRFRANWNVGVGAPDYTTTDVKNPSATPFDAALNVKLGGLVCLSNGLPYARRLENGYSQQAPQGMIRLTVAELSQHINTALAS